MASNNPVEPNATARQLAGNLMQVFIALKNEGFTEYQALVIIGQMLSASAGNQGKK